jgi:hypothetical protein
MCNAQVEQRSPNWLPLPFEEVAVNEPEVIEDDLFTKGEVVSIYPRQGMGVIKNDLGRLFPFNMKDAEFVGPKESLDLIRVGSRVGFDASWIKGGLKVTFLKIY